MDQQLYSTNLHITKQIVTVFHPVYLTDTNINAYGAVDGALVEVFKQWRNYGEPLFCSFDYDAGLYQIMEDMVTLPVSYT